LINTFIRATLKNKSKIVAFKKPPNNTLLAQGQKNVNSRLSFKKSEFFLNFAPLSLF